MPHVGDPEGKRPSHVLRRSSGKRMPWATPNGSCAHRKLKSISAFISMPFSGARDGSAGRPLDHRLGGRVRFRCEELQQTPAPHGFVF